MAIPVAVAVALIEDGHGRFLVTKRLSTDPLPGLWEFPGGKFEEGEDVIQALRREMMEELGVFIHVFQDTPYFQTLWLWPHGLCELNFVRCRLQHDQTPALVECQEFRFVTLEEIRELDFVASNLNVIRLLRLEEENDQLRLKLEIAEDTRNRAQNECTRQVLLKRAAEDALEQAKRGKSNEQPTD